MKRLVAVPFLLVALLVAALGSAAAAFHLRSRQAVLDQELSHAWQRLGLGLRDACVRLGEPVEDALDSQRMANILADTAAQSRLDAIGTRLDSICRSRSDVPGVPAGLDSLREAVRRDREHLGLVLARYREERHSFLGEKLLRGFPDR